LVSDRDGWVKPDLAQKASEVLIMLQLTTAAAAQVSALRRDRGLPEAAGLRVFEQAKSNGEMSFGVAFADAPAQGDEISELDGARVFVASEVAIPLAGAALDAEQTPEGTRLVLTRQR
jgi:Fe-S cluster assembly iron-binding protein IscA